MKTARACLILVFLLGGLVRGVDVWRPIDGSGELWREADVGGIARNFYREGMNILYPRIDWRGDGPGYVESEFPLYAWTMALLYRLLGYHEPLARLVSYALSLGACLLFFRFAWVLLPPVGALAAALVFTLSPLAVRLAPAIQAEPLMLLAYLAAVYCWYRWFDTDRRVHYWFSLAATTLAILAKLPAIHVGLLFAAFSFDRWRWRALRRWDLWLYAAVSLGVSFAWYGHARQLWQQYGNSLGASNEAYLRITSLSFLAAAPSTLLGIARIEILNVWMPTGILLGLYALRSVFTDPPRRFLLYWLGALAVFYLITGRTTGEGWATYYHVVSLPPAALLIGLGVAKVGAMTVPRRPWLYAAGFAGALGTLLLLLRFMPLTPPVRPPALLGLSLVLSGAVMLLPRIVAFSPDADSRFRVGLVGCALPALLLAAYSATLVFETRQVAADRQARRAHPFYACARTFAAWVPPGSLIVASGAPELDQHGLPRAYDAPYMFFWMDRKGWPIADGEQSLARLDDLARRGARFFVAEQSRVQTQPGFSSKLRTALPLLHQCRGALLFELRASPRAVADGVQDRPPNGTR